MPRDAGPASVSSTTLRDADAASVSTTALRDAGPISVSTATPSDAGPDSVSTTVPTDAGNESHEAQAAGRAQPGLNSICSPLGTCSVSQIQGNSHQSQVICCIIVAGLQG